MTKNMSLPGFLTSIFYYLFKEERLYSDQRQKKRQEKPSPVWKFAAGGSTNVVCGDTVPFLSFCFSLYSDSLKLLIAVCIKEY